LTVFLQTFMPAFASTHEIVYLRDILEEY
jgi:hypothetical protein